MASSICPAKNGNHLSSLFCPSPLAFTIYFDRIEHDTNSDSRFLQLPSPSSETITLLFIDSSAFNMVRALVATVALSGLAGNLLPCIVAWICKKFITMHGSVFGNSKRSINCFMHKLLFNTVSTNFSTFYINCYDRLSSSSKNPKRTSRGTRSSSVVVARERPTTVNASVFAARRRTSTNLPNTVSSFVSPISRLFARLPTLLSMETGF